MTNTGPSPPDKQLNKTAIVYFQLFPLICRFGHYWELIFAVFVQ
uniref:Uncharacterized protein n=1 Tax=Lepeophtheirus salmonis TaxID=72036 RepID=A0A0K2UEU3_LEPSM